MEPTRTHQPQTDELTPPHFLPSITHVWVENLYFTRTYNVLQETSGMNKTMIKVALVASVFAFGGCSTYNSYAPDWAKIGSSSTEAEASGDSAEKESTWWNPFSW